MTTLARIHPDNSSHYYWPDGRPCHQVPYTDATKGMRNTTLADCKKLKLIPSVTQILKLLDKPALTSWLIEQSVLAIITSPRASGEADDAFIQRVLNTDREQDQERDTAARLGTNIHAAIESAIQGRGVEGRFEAFVRPVMEAIRPYGMVIFSEKVLVGDGYAGRCDLCMAIDKHCTIVDFKTTKKLPLKSYPEQRLQLAAYARAKTGVEVTKTANIYISTSEPGQIKVCENTDIEPTYEAFMNLLRVWQWMNDYKPVQ